MRFLLTAAFALVFASAAFARDIAGSYDLEGANPGGSGRYAGKVEVVSSGDTFQVRWRIGNQSQQGTGILVGKTFAVSYRQDEDAGIAVYEIGNDGILSGVWAPMGSSAVGIEIWTPEPGI